MSFGDSSFLCEFEVLCSARHFEVPLNGVLVRLLSHPVGFGFFQPHSCANLILQQSPTAVLCRSEYFKAVKSLALSLSSS